MIVSYKGKKETGEDKNTDENTNLVINKDYIVHQITFNPSSHSPQSVILDEDDNYPVLFNLGLFEIIDNRIPEGWIFKYYSSGYIHLSPQEFAGDFWEKFHDGDPEAEAVFEQVARKLRLFHGWKVKRLPEEDVVENLLRENEDLIDRYNYHLGPSADEYADPVVLSVKLECLSKALKDMMADNTLSPQTLINALHAIENYTVMLEDETAKQDLSSLFFKGLMEFLEGVIKEQEDYRYFDLFKDNLGPASEELCEHNNAFWREVIQQKNEKYKV